jgi:hypothetical protein
MLSAGIAILANSCSSFSSLSLQYGRAVRGTGTSELIFGVIFGFAVLILLFLVLREFFCWYWKINRIVSLLEKIAAGQKGAEVNPQIKG